MQGMKFLIVNSKGESVNYGFIVSIPAPGKFLCKFLLVPTVSRVVDIKELETFNLFDSHAEMDTFIKQLTEDALEKSAKEQVERIKQAAADRQVEIIVPAVGKKKIKKKGKKVKINRIVTTT